MQSLKNTMESKWPKTVVFKNLPNYPGHLVLGLILKVCFNILFSQIKCVKLGAKAFLYIILLNPLILQQSRPNYPYKNKETVIQIG